MIEEEEKNRIIFQLNKKQTKEEYKKMIIKYIEINNELFPFLNINEVINRILYNFNKVSLNVTSFIYNDYGQYILTNGKILLSPNILFGKNKKYKESVFLHELDHCACTPVEVKMEYMKYKEKIKKKSKSLCKIIPEFIFYEFFLKIHYNGSLSGISNLKSKNRVQKMLYGINIQDYLNEGITSLKQKIYSEKLHIDFNKNKDFLCIARLAAECIANVIGFENIIYYHFYNNYEKIEKIFFDKTKVKLDELILKFIIYDKTRSKKNLKKLSEFTKEIFSKKNG